MPDNIFPDLTNARFDVKYHQLRVLGSDIRRSLGGGRYSTGTGSDPVVIEPSSSSSGGSGDGNCKRWVNVGRDAATGVSYIDCDGGIILGQTIAPGDSFCAEEVTNPGTCGAIVQSGNCVECAPCCAPTVLSVTFSVV